MENLLAIARNYRGPWDNNLLLFLAEAEKISLPALKLLLPNGLEDLVDFYFETLERHLILDKSLVTIQSKVYYLLVELVSSCEKDAIFTGPLLKAPITLLRKSRIILRGAKNIWDLVDTASDFSYYTRIASLSSIYARALVLLKEGSDWRLGLDKDFAKLGKIIKCKKKLFSF